MSSPEPNRFPNVEIEVDSASSEARIVRLVGTDKFVLELGCSTGSTARILRDRGCRVIGVEANPEAARRAAAFCERVIIGDAEQVDLLRMLAGEHVDVVIAADFIEHLKDPRSMLRKIKDVLQPNGYLVASVPNVAHGSVRLGLLGGAFPSGGLGPPDETHLHFFTRASLEQIFAEAGYTVTHLEAQNRPIQASEIPFDEAAIQGLLETLSTDPDAVAYEFVLVAYPRSAPEPGDDESEVQARDSERESLQGQRELAELRRTVRQQREHIQALLAQLEAGQARENEFRSMLLDTHDQLVRRDDALQALQTRLLDEQQVRQAMAENQQLQQSRVDKDRHIGNLEALLADRERQLADAEGALIDKDRHIGNLEGFLADRELQLANLEAVLTARQRQIDAIFSRPVARFYRTTREVVANILSLRRR